MNASTADVKPAASDRPLPSLWLLWSGLLAGPGAWATQLTVNYFFVTLSCRNGYDLTLLLHAVSAVMLLTALAGGGVSLWAYRRLGSDEGPQDAIARRARFMATSGMLLSVLGLTLVVLSALPVFFLESCSAH